VVQIASQAAGQHDLADPPPGWLFFFLKHPSPSRGETEGSSPFSFLGIHFLLARSLVRTVLGAPRGHSLIAPEMFNVETGGFPAPFPPSRPGMVEERTRIRPHLGLGQPSRGSMALPMPVERVTFRCRQSGRKGRKPRGYGWSHLIRPPASLIDRWRGKAPAWWLTSSCPHPAAFGVAPEPGRHHNTVR